MATSFPLAHCLFDGLVGLVGLSLGQRGEVEDAVRPLGVETLVDVGGEAEKPGVSEKATVEGRVGGQRRGEGRGTDERGGEGDRGEGRVGGQTRGEGTEERGTDERGG